MKIKSLTLSNFAGYGKVNVSFDENVTYLIGKNGSGKSTIGVTAIHFILQGIAEKGKNVLIGERFRFIGNGAVSGSGELTLIDEKKNNAEIIVKRRLTKSGNELSFQAPEGYKVDKEWLDNLFNVFLIAPKKFTELSSKQQAETLGINTSDLDEEIKDLKAEFTLINRDLTNLGNITPIDPVEKVDIAKLIEEKDEITAFNQLQDEAAVKIEKANTKIAEYYQQAKRISDYILELEEKISSEKNKGLEIAEKISKGLEYVSELPEAKEAKSLDVINEKLKNASTINENAFKYNEYLKKKEKKENIEAKLATNKENQKIKLQERVDYIKNQKLPFDNLTITEEGELMLSGKPIKEPYFSSGELLKIVPILMSARNPELKYVFIQDFNLLDEDMQLEVEKALTEKGMQLVIELVGSKRIEDKNCILLKDCQVVEEINSESKSIL